MNSGVTLQSVQYMICVDGKYGRKDWSSEEREAACKQFKEMTGVDIQPVDNSSNVMLLTGGAILILVVGIIIGYTVGQYSSNRKGSKKALKKSRK